MIRCKCNDCGERMEVPEAMSGQGETCPHCGAAVIVPSPPAGSATDASAAPGKAAPVSQRRSGHRLILQGALVFCFGLGGALWVYSHRPMSQPDFFRSMAHTVEEPGVWVFKASAYHVLVCVAALIALLGVGGLVLGIARTAKAAGPDSSGVAGPR